MARTEGCLKGINSCKNVLTFKFCFGIMYKPLREKRWNKANQTTAKRETKQTSKSLKKVLTNESKVDIMYQLSQKGQWRESDVMSDVKDLENWTTMKKEPDW
jgi:exopolysaccharide biosynthesis protein